MADSYTITFKDGGTDSDKTSSLTSTTVSDYVDAGAEYVSAIAPTGKVYFAKTGAGLKFGNSSGGGSVTLTLATPIKPTSIVISASQFGASEGSGLFQEETFDMTGGGGKYAFNDYTVTYDGETEVATISVGTAKRGYVNSITVNYASQGGEEPVVEPTTKTIYLNGGGSSLWNQANPEFFVHSWGGAADGDVHMTLVEGDVYKADIPADNTNLLFLRLATGTTEIVWSGDAHWNQSTDQTIPEGKDLFTMTSWDNGEWSVYTAQGGDDPEPVDPTPAEKDSIYFVNVAGWAAPRVHLWGGTAAGTEWPGVEMTKLDDQINNYDVYKYVADKGAYANCLFSDNGAEDKKTADLTWTSGKYFYNDAWYALNEIPAPVEPQPVDSMTVYYVNETAWENVDAFVWPAEGEAYKAWPGEAMTKEAEQINGFDVYSYTFPASYVNIIFNNGNSGEDNQTADLVWEEAKPYFYDGAWYAKAGIPTGGEQEQEEFVGFDARTVNLGEQIAAGLAKNLVNVTFDETSTGKYSVNLVEGGVEGSFSFGGVIFAYTNSNAGTTAYKTFGTYIQPNGKDREVRIPLNAGEKANVILTEACAGVLVNDVSTDLVSGENILTATEGGLILKTTGSSKPKIQAILPVVVPVDSMTVYFVNNLAWEAVNAYVWPAEGDAAYKAWPGEAMTKEAEQINGFDVYSYKFPASYVNLIFNNGNSGEGNQTDNLVWDATKPYFFDGEWYASVEEVAPHCAQVTEGIWTVTETTPLDANSIYVHNNLMKMKPAYAAAWDGFNNPQQFGEYSFTYAMLIRSEALPTEQIPAGVEYVGGNKNTTSLIVEAKEDIDITIFYRRQTGNQSENDSKDLKIFDHSAITTAIQGVFQIVELDGDYFSATKKLSLVKGHRYTITAKGTTPKIFAIAYGQPAEPDPAKFYVTGDAALVGEEIAWHADAIKVTEDSYTFENLAAGDYKLKVTVNGTWEEGMVKGFSDLTTVADGLTADDGGAICFTLAEAGNVVVTYTAEAFTLSGNFYVAPVDPQGLYLIGNAPEMASWAIENALPMDGDSIVLNLAEGGYAFKIVPTKAWDQLGQLDCNAIAEGQDKLSCDGSYNICFTMPSAAEVTIKVIENKVYVLGIPDGEYIIPTTHYLIGNVEQMGEWNIENAVFMDGDSLQLTLAEGTIMFKIVTTKAWDQPGQLDCSNLAEGQANVGCEGNNVDQKNVKFILNEEATITIKVIEDEIYVLGIPEGSVEPQPTEHTYTVAGNSAAAFGTGWAQTEAANDMVKQEDGTYKWEKTELVLPAGTIEFKVVVDHAWDVAYPNDNYQLAIVEAGEYTITITFDPETKAIAANAEKTAVVEVDPTVSAKGSWDEWANELAFVLSDDKATATLTVNNVAAGTYEFKVILNGGDWRSNSHVFTREAASSEGITGNDNDNMQLVADVEGEYTFTWTFATNSLAIEFPEGGEIVDPTLANGYYLIGQNGWNVAALSADLLFTANPNNEGEYVLTTTLAENDHIKVVKVQNDVIMAWYPDGEGNEYIVDAAHAGKGKAIYFQETYKEDWSAFGGYIWIDQNEATAISNTAADAEAVKVLHNGMLLIRKGNKTYNIMGQAVK